MFKKKQKCIKKEKEETNCQIFPNVKSSKTFRNVRSNIMFSIKNIFMEQIVYWKVEDNLYENVIRWEKHMLA